MISSGHKYPWYGMQSLLAGQYKDICLKTFPLFLITARKVCFLQTFLYHILLIGSRRLIPIRNCRDFTSLYCSASCDPNFCHAQLHLWFSAKPRIWQVPACKMEPQCGIIIWRNSFPPAPAAKRTDPPATKLFLSMLCGVPTPILPPIFKVCAPIFSKKTLGFLPSLGRSPTNPRMVTHQKEV